MTADKDLSFCFSKADLAQGKHRTTGGGIALSGGDGPYNLLQAAASCEDHMKPLQDLYPWLPTDKRSALAAELVSSLPGLRVQ